MQNNPNINAERIKGHLELDAGTIASAPLHLNDGVGVSSPIVGDIDFISDRITIETTGGTEQLAYLSDISVSGVTSVTGTSNRITSTGGSNPQIDIAVTYIGQSSITTLGTITTGTWNATSISDTYISSASTWNAKQNALSGTGFVKISGTTISYDNSTYLTSVTGTTNRISITGSSTIDIAATYVGQSSITTLGTIGTGVWQGTSISTTYTDAKIVSVTGTTNRITSSGGANPSIDISSSYVGQSSITTVGTIGTGTWQGTAIADTYISSASTWNAKQNALSGTGFVKISGTTISYDNSTYLTKGTMSTNDILYWDGTNAKGNGGTFQFDASLSEMKLFGGIRLNANDRGGGTYVVVEADYTVISNTGTNGSSTYELPQASSAVLGKVLCIKNTGTAMGHPQLIVRPHSGDTIDGSGAAISLLSLGASPGSLNAIILQCTGSEWIILADHYV